MAVVTMTILSEGEAMDPGYGVLSLEVSKEVNRIPTAQLSLVDGDVTRGEFPISDSAFFEPGKAIEIKLRYEGEADVTVFKGLVMCQGVQASQQGAMLTVELKDAAIKLTQSRRSVVYRELSDADIIGRIIDEAGLSSGELVATEPVHSEIVQYYATDWDFMLSRADTQGQLVKVDDGTLSLNAIDLSAEALHQFEYGLSELYDFEFELDASHQYGDIESVAWDIEEQQLSEVSPAESFDLVQGNIDAAAVAQTIGFDSCRLSHPVPLDPAEQQAWANARMSRSRLAMLRGRLSVRGMPELKPLDVMELAGVGERFNGKTLITGVRHLVDSSGWRSDLQFGLSPQCFARQPNIQAMPSAGLLPPVSGLQLGVVDSFEEDPDQLLRVRVLLPAIDTEDGAVWARLASPDAGNERGYFFRPEPGDEVVVGFFNNDPRQAIILGAMFSTSNAPPAVFAELTEDNFHKGIVTKTGTRIGFDDEKAAIVIETAQSNKILLDDDAETIEISDQHGNTITLGSSGIEMVSASDFKIEASGNVEIIGSQVDVK